MNDRDEEMFTRGYDQGIKEGQAWQRFQEEHRRRWRNLIFLVVGFLLLAALLAKRWGMG